MYQPYNVCFCFIFIHRSMFAVRHCLQINVYHHFYLDWIFIMQQYLSKVCIQLEILIFSVSILFALRRSITILRIIFLLLIPVININIYLSGVFVSNKCPSVSYPVYYDLSFIPFSNTVYMQVSFSYS